MAYLWPSNTVFQKGVYNFAGTQRITLMSECHKVVENRFGACSLITEFAAGGLFFVWRKKVCSPSSEEYFCTLYGKQPPSRCIIKCQPESCPILVVLSNMCSRTSLGSWNMRCPSCESGILHVTCVESFANSYTFVQHLKKDDMKEKNFCTKIIEENCDLCGDNH